MQRRTLLAAAGTMATVGVTGCVGRLSEPTPLEVSDIQEDGRDRQFVYGQVADPILSITFTDRGRLGPDLHKIRFTLAQPRGDTELESFAIRFQDDEAALGAYLEAGAPYDAMELYRDGGDAVISVPDVGLAEGVTTGAQVLLERHTDGEVWSISVDHRVTLSETGVFGGKYDVHDNWTFDLPRTV